MIPSAQQNESSRAVVLVVTTLSSFLTPFMASSVTIALPAIGKDFRLGAVGLGWVVSVYLIAAAVFLVPFGKFADIHGRKLFFSWGILVYTFFSFLAGISPNVLWLIGFRFFQGTGAAMVFATGMAILVSANPGEKRGRVLGINTAAVYLGLSLGPPLGGVITRQLGWRYVFLFQIPLGLFILVLILTRLKGEWAQARNEHFDWMGSFIFSSSLILLMIGFSFLPTPTGYSLIVLGGAGTIGLVALEKKKAFPVLEVSLFSRNPHFTFSNLAALIHYSATFAVGFLLSLYLQSVKGFDAQKAGLILITQPVLQALFSPIAGRLSDRIQPRIVASIGMALTAGGLLFFILIGEHTALRHLVAGLMFLGFGFAFFSSPNTNAVMGAVEPRSYGVASGILGTMRLIGQMFSMALVMMVFSLILGRTKVAASAPELFLQSMRIAFLIMMVLCLVALSFSLIPISFHRRQRSKRE